MRHHHWLGRLGLLAAALAAPALAQDTSYPDRPIRIVVPFPPGGANDTVTRIVADRLSARFGQPVVVENKPGAAGNIGAEMVAHAKPDGYTLLASPPPPLVINHSLYPRLGFDPTRFVPITVMAAAPNVLVAHPRVAAGNATEFIVLARQQPGRLNYASTGGGGTPHLTFEWFKSVAGIQVTHVPYKGVQAYPAVLSGEVDAMFMNLSDALPHVRSGKLKALAVASEREVTALPGVRPLSDTLPGFVSITWFGVAAPSGTPGVLADKIASAIAEALKDPDAARLADLHLQPVGEPPARGVLFFSGKPSWRRYPCRRHQTRLIWRSPMQMVQMPRRHPVSAGFHLAGFRDVDGAGDAEAYLAYLDSVGAVFRDVIRFGIEALRLRAGGAVLDVGCGHGACLPLLAQQVGLTGRVAGLDSSTAMVEAARRRVMAQGVATKIEHGDAHALPFGDAAFDATRIDRVLMFLRDPRQAIAELVRVTRAGGRVCVTEGDIGTHSIDANDVATTRTILAPPIAAPTAGSGAGCERFASTRD